MFLPEALLRQEQLNDSGKRVVSLPRPWRDWSSDGWWSTLAVAPRSVLLLDYDGTLAPFKTQRMQAAPYLGVLRRLTQLLERPKVRLILLSGRPARELARLLPGLKVEVWGSNGRERLLPDGSYEVVPLTLYQSGALAWLESTLKENGFSTVIETKPGGLALHTREREPQLERQLIELFPALFRQLSDQTALEWQSFDGGFEVRASGCSTADAVNCVLNEEQFEGAVAYLGDDLADEEAFRLLDDKGLKVLVRCEPRDTFADIWLKPPEELLKFLDRWLEAST